MSQGRTAMFIADHSFTAQSDGELSFIAGDNIKILNEDGDWWFGELARTGEKGWISPSYGHVAENESPYASASDQEKLIKRKAMFSEIYKSELAFQKNLEVFNKVIIAPLQTRNTPFKRNFLNEPSIAVSLNLLKDILTASIGILKELQLADTPEKLAATFLHIAPVLNLYAQYASENAACLNSVKFFGRQLKEFTNENPLPNNLTLETCLISPLEHYPIYATNLQELIWYTPNTNPEYSSLQNALNSINSQTEKVDETLNELAENVKLLSLQNQCKY
jgi:hypothetical protein